MPIEFQVEMRDPTTLAPSPRNFRRHSDEQRHALKQSISESGWLATILYNERTGHILDGHARVEYACEEGLEVVPVHVVNVDEEKELRILASFDRIGDLATLDKETLLALLEDCSTDDSLLPGWSKEDVLILMSETQSPDFSPGNLEEQGRLDEREPLTCPECGATFSPPR